MTFAHLQLSSLEQLQYKTQCVSGSCACGSSITGRMDGAFDGTFIGVVRRT
jgi:hypothetical protein